MTSDLPLVQYEKRVYPFPTDPLERVGNNLAAYNSSAKALTQLLITSQPVTRLELSKRFEASVAGTALEATDSYNVNKYCRHSLCPLGLVVHEQMPSSGRYPYVITYALTAAGRRYGQPAAAAFLEFELKNGFSLFPVLGATFSTTTDDPKPKLTRALILCELMKGSKRAIELATSLGRSESVIKRTLPLLARCGVITYTTLNTRTQETQVTFILAKTATGDVVPVSRYSRLTPIIAQICKVLDKRRIPITQSAVSSRVRNKREKSNQGASLNTLVNEVLSGLVKQGYLKREKFSRNTKSMATITAKGICVVENLIIPLMEAMQDGSSLTRWQQTLLPKVQSNLSLYAEKTGALYYPFSKSRDKVERTNRLSLLKKLLQTGNGKTISQLARVLGVNQMTISLYLNQLEEDSPICKKTQKSVAYYSLPDTQEISVSSRSL